VAAARSPEVRDREAREKAWTDADGLGTNGRRVKEEQRMATTQAFTSPEIAKEMVKLFGAEAKTVTVEIKYRREVGEFVRKIEKAHRDAEKSTLVFR